MENVVIIHDQENKSWLQFENPIEVLTTNEIEHVSSVLKKLEARVAEGYYVAGFLSYESAAAFDSALKTKISGDFPLIWFGVYNEPQRLLLPNSNVASKESLHWNISSGKTQYQKAFQKIKQYLHSGQSYQVNYTLRKEAVLNENPWDLFGGMIREAPYGAFIDLEDYSICSASPELFFQYQDGNLLSRPMKGTIQRGRSYTEDQQYRNQLFNSQKDRSENVMIVDMIRNDLGKIAKTGSVQVPKLFEIEQYPTVWQMTSTVEAKINKSIIDIFSALFPCASITGAPKVSAMKIIDELETNPRKIYTGSIGFITPARRMQFNVAIRTALVDKKSKRIEYGMGGGIVWDSDAEKEYEECLLKTKVLENSNQHPPFDLLETLLWSPEEGYFLLSEHFDRLEKTAQYFNYPLDLDAMKSKLQILPGHFEKDTYKIRLLVSKDGSFKTEFTKLYPILKEERRKVYLAEEPINSNDQFLFHKTTNRTIYNEQLKKHSNFHDVLLWNKKGQLTEACNANIVVRWNDKFLTPPVHCGLLNGTFRGHLNKQGIISEAILLVENLPDFEEIYLINSVRKWQRVEVASIPLLPPVITATL